ncbi:hypothetical protein HU200_011864 [Digitaria exilis]|uniref:Uncharacterized protein n=1 Tax=Digitaria exilis TaxID=1010633 RepID=A0A835FGG0_9POAL|nr:hypothetical protein HU200_011864 [Digitaria exilis]
MATAPQGQKHDEQPHAQRRPMPTTTSNRPGGSTIATNRWGPYSGAGDFASNMAVILAALLATLALALALNAAVRYILRRSLRRPQGAGSAAEAAADRDPEKASSPPPPPPPPPPELVYSAAGTKLAGAAAECAICLAEFVDGGRRARHAGMRPWIPRALHRAVARRGTPVFMPDLPRAAGLRRRSCGSSSA